MLFNRGAFNQRGFTLAEMMVIIAIIGKLAVIAVPHYINEVNYANGAKLKTDLQTIDVAVALAQANGCVLVAVADIISDPAGGGGRQCPGQLSAASSSIPMPPKGMTYQVLQTIPTLIPATVYRVDA